MVVYIQPGGAARHLDVDPEPAVMCVNRPLAEHSRLLSEMGCGVWHIAAYGIQHGQDLAIAVASKVGKGPHWPMDGLAEPLTACRYCTIQYMYSALVQVVG
jgi:hypothetical protein